MNKDFKIFGVRGSLLGDSVGALTVLNYLEKLYPNSYKYWQIASKCSHMAPLFLGHPMIDKIIFSDCSEGMGVKDFEIAKDCQIIMNVMPNHPLEQDWPNYRSFYKETFIMSGLSENNYDSLPIEEKYPKLYKWFRPEPRPSNHKKIVSIWGFASYGGKEVKRNPSKEYWERLAHTLLDNGYGVCQFGHPKDPILFDDTSVSGDFIDRNFKRFNDLDFFQQIRMTLSTDLVLSTDSGSGLIFAAYDMNQINLIARHWPGHVQNPLALAPIGKNTLNFLGGTGCDSINIDSVMNAIKEKI